MKLFIFALGFAFSLPVASSAAPAPGGLPAPAQPVAPVAKTTSPTTPSVPAKASVIDPLGIPLFYGVPSEFEFSGTQDDLLGVLQGLVAGMKVEAVKPAAPEVGGAEFEVCK